MRSSMTAPTGSCRGNKGDARFRGEVAWIGQQALDKGLTKAFVTELRGRPELRKRFGQISRRLRDPEANVDWDTYWNCHPRLASDARPQLRRGPGA